MPKMTETQKFEKQEIIWEIQERMNELSRLKEKIEADRDFDKISNRLEASRIWRKIIAA